MKYTRLILGLFLICGIISGALLGSAVQQQRIYNELKANNLTICSGSQTWGWRPLENYTIDIKKENKELWSQPSTEVHKPTDNCGDEDSCYQNSTNHGQ